MSSAEIQSNPYIVLARKWRPSQFVDIVGQAPIVRTLMNAIRSGRIHPGYLLTGSRGIGKTSIARIFAKAVRCENQSWEEKTSQLQSCGTCASCKEISAGSSVDVIEIDGASNNGVDAVREIRENVKYLPASGSKKIYIIDEVHMLTTAAFNALLKTLEEPPPHVIFIFATTEPHKIPGTILSRCQRFDLRRVTFAQIQDRLDQVTRAEQIEAEAGALALIAKAADGSMRDALSLLDQVIAFAGKKISAQAARDSIGLIEGQTLIGLTRSIFARDPVSAIRFVSQAYQAGHDLRVLSKSLLEYLYAAILWKISPTSSAEAGSGLDLSPDEWQEIGAIAPLRSLEEMELIFQVIHHGIEWIARSPQPKLVLDVLVIKCASSEGLYQLGNTSEASGGAARTNAQQAISSATAVPSPTPKQQLAPAPAPVQQPVAPAAPIVSAVPPVEVVAQAIPAQAQAPAPASSERKDWEGFIALVRQTRPLLASLLEHGNCEVFPQSADQHELILCYPPADAYYKDQLQARVYAEQLQSLCKTFFGRAIQIRVELKDTGESVAARRMREQNEREEDAKRNVQNNPIINEARALFGGELGPIELVESGPRGADLQ